MVVELTDYERFEIEMQVAGKWCPCLGETIYIPYDDAIDVWAEEWDGNITQQELAKDGLIYPTANEALARARKDFEEALGHVG